MEILSFLLNTFHQLRWAFNYGIIGRIMTSFMRFFENLWNFIFQICHNWRASFVCSLNVTILSFEPTDRSSCVHWNHAKLIIDINGQRVWNIFFVANLSIVLIVLNLIIINFFLSILRIFFIIIISILLSFFILFIFL